MSRSIRAVLWDNDGVLVDTERLYFQATREVMGSVGVALDQAAFQEHFLRDSRGAWHLVAERGLDERQIAALRAERDRRHSALLSEPGLAVGGAGEVLERLHGEVRMAVVTSAWREHFELSHRHTGFRAKFDLVLTREDYARSKPDPEPYLLALDRLGLEPIECVVVEDSERGLRAAKAAGITCWVIPTDLTADGDFGAADRVLDHIGQVPGLILASDPGA